MKKRFLHVENPWALGAILSIAIAIWLVFGIILVVNFYRHSPESSGLLGDTFGVINSLFSSLAFAGLFYTILLQKKELSETKNEFIKQNKTLKQQRFESTFFNLLTIHNELTKSMKVVGKFSQQHRGRDYFSCFATELSTIKIALAGKNIELMKGAFQTKYKRFKNSFNLYMESLYCILNIVANSDLEERTLYFSILKSTISDHEKICIYYFLGLRNQNEISKKILVIENEFKIITDLKSTFFHKSHKDLLELRMHDYFPTS